MLFFLRNIVQRRWKFVEDSAALLLLYWVAESSNSLNWLG